MRSLFKKDKKIELLTDMTMLLMVEGATRGGICHAIHRYAKANNNYMKMIKTKNHHVFNISMQTIYMDGQCLKNCLWVVTNGKEYS